MPYGSMWPAIEIRRKLNRKLGKKIVHCAIDTKKFENLQKLNDFLRKSTTLGAPLAAVDARRHFDKIR